MSRVLGIDGGGTTTRAFLVEASSQVLNRGFGESIKPNFPLLKWPVLPSPYKSPSDTPSQPNEHLNGGF